MIQTTDESKDIFNSLHVARLNIIKEIFELHGFDLGESKSNVIYHNYMDSGFVGGSNPYSFGGDKYHGYVMPSLKAKPISSAEQKANGALVMTMLMSQLGLTKIQAAGVAGVLTAESGINPKSINVAEKNGELKDSAVNNQGTPYGTPHSPWSYGAGICQWSFCDRKEKAIMGGLSVSKEEAKEIIITKGIESLSLNDQIKMLIYELRTSYKNTLIGLKKCETPEQAAATYYCHCVAGFSSSKNPATMAEVEYQNRRYGAFAKQQINKGMQYAKSYSV